MMQLLIYIAISIILAYVWSLIITDLIKNTKFDSEDVSSIISITIISVLWILLLFSVHN